MIKRFQLFLGPARLQSLFFLLAATGLASLILNVFVKEYDWVRPVQSALVLAFAVGVVVIIGGRLDSAERGRWLAIIVPSVGLFILGVLFLPQFLLPLMGAAIGWIIAGTFLFRGRLPMEYQKAVKALRKNEYAEAVKIMDGVIRDEPKNAQHYRFRAEVLRVWGKLDRARRDYTTMTELEPDSAVAFNGLAEVNLQYGDFQRALDAANRAYELAPSEWVALYNLGMIEDRLGQSEGVVDHLQQALRLKVPDVRHRLLMYFYLARAYSRLGDQASAKEQVAALRKQRSGLREWQSILENEQAATLRVVIGPDVDAAEALADGKLDLAALANGSS